MNVNIQFVKRRRSILNGICAKAIHLLKDERVNPVTFDVLRHMKPSRQIEASHLMKAMGNFTSAYAKALLASTDETGLKTPPKTRPANSASRAGIARMELELKAVQLDFRAI